MLESATKREMIAKADLSPEERFALEQRVRKDDIAAQDSYMRTVSSGYQRAQAARAAEAHQREAVLAGR
jgi:hypothetical protein